MAHTAPETTALTAEQLESEAANLRNYSKAYLAIDAAEFTDEEREEHGQLISRATVRAGRHFAAVFARGADVVAECAKMADELDRLRATLTLLATAWDEKGMEMDAKDAQHYARTHEMDAFVYQKCAAQLRADVNSSEMASSASDHPITRKD